MHSLTTKTASKGLVNTWGIWKWNRNYRIWLLNQISLFAWYNKARYCQPNKVQTFYLAGFACQIKYVCTLFGGNNYTLFTFPTLSVVLIEWIDFCVFTSWIITIYSLLPLYYPQFRGFSVDQGPLCFPREIKYFIQLVKTQQSIYSIKSADKVGKVNKTTYLPVENKLYFPQILMFFPRIVYFSSFHSEKYNNPLEKHQNHREIKLYFS